MNRSGLIDEYRRVVAESTRFKLAHQTTFKTGAMAVELQPAPAASQALLDSRGLGKAALNLR